MIDQVSFDRTSFTTGVQRFEAGTLNVSGAIGLGEAESVKSSRKSDFSKAHPHEKMLQAREEHLYDVKGLIEHGTVEDKAGCFLLHHRWYSPT